MPPKVSLHCDHSSDNVSMVKSVTHALAVRNYSVQIKFDRVLLGLLLSIYCCLVTKSSDMLNKNTLGAKSCKANQKQQLNGYSITRDQNV